MPNGTSRRLPIPDPDEYDRYVFGDAFDERPVSDDEDIWQSMWWSGHYHKHVIADNSVCHTFCSSGTLKEAERVRDGSCVICLENFKDGDALRVLRCVHSFHRDCVDQWLESSRVCPICKQDVTGSPIWITPTEAANSSDSDLASSFFAFEAGQVELASQAHLARMQTARPLWPLILQSGQGPAIRLQSVLSALSASTASAVLSLHHQRISQVLQGTIAGPSQTGERRQWTLCQHRNSTPGDGSGSQPCQQGAGPLAGGQSGQCQPGALAQAVSPEPSSPSSGVTSDTESSSSSCSSPSSSSSDEPASPWI